MYNLIQMHLLENITIRKVIISVFFCFILCFSTVFCFADNDNTDNTENDSLPNEQTLQEYQDFVDSQQEIIAYNETVLRVSSNNTNGFQSVVLSLLGDYEPIVKDYTYQSNNGYISHSIEIQPDYSWICSAAIFAIVLFCVFRLIGGIFSWRQ